MIRRQFDLLKNADEQTLSSAAEKAIEDEGYEPGLMNVSLRR